MDPSAAVRQGDWFVLLDPSWISEGHPGDPPLEVLVGGWRREKDGELGPFQPNPGYLPQSPEAPAIPSTPCCASST